MADTINTLITGIESSKDDIATSIAGKGVTVPSGTKLAGMSSLIDQISTMHGPASSVDGNLAAFDGTSGDILKDSGIAMTDVVTKSGNNTFTGTNTFEGLIGNYLYGKSVSGLVLQDSAAEDAGLGLYESGAQLYGTAVSITATGGGNIDLIADGNYNINLFDRNYSGSGKAYYKGDEIATVAGTKIEIVDLTTINSGN